MEILKPDKNNLLSVFDKNVIFPLVLKRGFFAINTPKFIGTSRYSLNKLGIPCDFAYRFCDVKEDKRSVLWRRVTKAYVRMSILAFPIAALKLLPPIGLYHHYISIVAVQFLPLNRTSTVYIFI